MNKSIFAAVMESHERCLGNAALVKLGQEGIKLASMPLSKALPKEMEGVTDSALAQVAMVTGIVAAADNYGVEVSEGVSRALFAGAWVNLLNSIGKDKVKEIEEKYIEVLGTPVHQPSMPTIGPVANTSKGGANKVDVNPLFQSKPGGVIDPRFVKPAANTTAGGENTATVYMPKSLDECEKNDKNLLRCPDLLGLHASDPDKAWRQRDKMQPYLAGNFDGYRADLDGVIQCGVCRAKLQESYHVDKKAKDAELAKVKEKEEAEAKLKDLNEQYITITEKFEKAEKTRGTFAEQVKADPTNEDMVEALANQEKKVAALKAEQSRIENEAWALELIIDPTQADTKEAPAVEEEAPAAPSAPAANTATGNVKVAVSAAERHKQNKNKKSGKK